MQNADFDLMAVKVISAIVIVCLVFVFSVVRSVLVSVVFVLRILNLI
jgi:hypothetical protein